MSFTLWWRKTNRWTVVWNNCWHNASNAAIKQPPSPAVHPALIKGGCVTVVIKARCSSISIPLLIILIGNLTHQIHFTPVSSYWDYTSLFFHRLCRLFSFSSFSILFPLMMFRSEAGGDWLFQFSLARTSAEQHLQYLGPNRAPRTRHLLVGRRKTCATWCISQRHYRHWKCDTELQSITPPTPLVTSPFILTDVGLTDLPRLLYSWEVRR